MNKFLGVIPVALFLICAFLYLFCVTYVSPGYTGVCINILAKEDVQNTSLGTGMHILPPWYRIWKFPLFEQNVSWEGKDAFEFQTSEGLATHADIGVTFSVDVEKTPTLFRKYRSGIDEISQKFLRNYLRDAVTMSASSRGIEELYGKGKERFLREVEENVQCKLRPLGLIVSRVYLIDALEFPTTVVNALNTKIEAAQRAEQRENELREAEAQAKKDIAKAHGEAESITLRATAEANANKLVSESVTQELIMYEGIKAWNGKLPETVSTNGTPLLLR